jgi:Protein of unknown function (DUF3011)
MNRTMIGTCTGLLALASVSWPLAASANYSVTCESKGNNYQRCPISQAGYVTLTRNLSKTDCVRGRNWDFDRREIWVDDGCRAQFSVNTSSYSDHGSHGGSSDGAKVAGALIGLAVLGAAIHNSQHKDDNRYQDDRYNDASYHGSRHSSYMPGWMVGTFEGYNPQYNATIELTIGSDGQARGTADSRAGSARINGWVSNQELHVGDSTFSINQTRDGFVTSELGDSYNQVHYRRVR